MLRRVTRKALRLALCVWFLMLGLPVATVHRHLVEADHHHHHHAHGHHHHHGHSRSHSHSHDHAHRSAKVGEFEVHMHWFLAEDSHEFEASKPTRPVTDDVSVDAPASTLWTLSLPAATGLPTFLTAAVVERCQPWTIQPTGFGPQHCDEPATPPPRSA